MAKGKSIRDYGAKRDFERTPEPPAGEGAGRAGSVFVVHRHEARRLHYDLRLEMEGVLRSWAVPKGFSYDPSVKHLAVRTEDHPLEYEDFEGLIPPGEYGAGAMTIWDRGRWHVVKADDAARAVEAGELKVVLCGRRLRGEWHLVKTNQGPDTWLLFKSKDRYAGPARDSALGVELAAAREAPLPTRVRRMEPGSTAAPFSDPAWLFEMEFAGQRVLAEKRGEAVRLRGVKHPPQAVAAALGRLRAESALLDGVLVATDASGRPSREALEAALGNGDEGPLALYVFDLLHWEDYDLRPLTLLDRKSALRAVLPEDPGPLLYVDHVAGDGEHLAEACAAAGVEAALAKRADAPYCAGPSEAWVRVSTAGIAPRAAAAGLRRSRVKLSNLHKVFWPAEGYTKGDLLEYYEAVADALLPYLRDRPVHLNRFPDGIEGKSFYQRHPPEHLPDWIETEWIEGSEGADKRHILCNDRDTLLHLINWGSIDLHPWLSHRPTYDEPDWTILDVDAKESPWEHAVRVAKVAGRILRGIGMRPLVKTSGKSGLHVLVPLEEGTSYEQSRLFCEGVARVVVRELPDIATVERSPSKRGGKVYADFGQNGRGQTVVPPYVVRPVPGATVSTPLDWDELEAGARREDFTLRTVPERLARLGDLFRPALTDRQELLPAIERLEEYVRRA